MARPMSQPIASTSAKGVRKCKSTTGAARQSMVAKQEASNIQAAAVAAAAATTTITSQPPVQTIDKRKRIAANARERKRMHLLNKAYDKLRKRLVDAENKSKYDVLVQAKEYIQALTRICENFDKNHPNECPKVSAKDNLATRDDEQQLSGHFQQYQRQSAPTNCQPILPSLSPSTTTTVKLEPSPGMSPAPSTSLSGCDLSCFSPVSQPDSVISTCSQPPAQVVLQPANAVDDNQNFYSDYKTIQRSYQHQLVPQQQTHECLDSCSALLSPTPSTSLSPPGTNFGNDCMYTSDSFLMGQQQSTTTTTYPSAAQATSNKDIHRYYQTFYHFQRAAWDELAH
jgi:hypothetical protein